MLKEETTYSVTKYFHFLAVWIKFDTFYIQIFPPKRGNLVIRENLSSLRSHL